MLELDLNLSEQSDSTPSWVLAGLHKLATGSLISYVFSFVKWLRDGVCSLTSYCKHNVAVSTHMIWSELHFGQQWEATFFALFRLNKFRLITDHNQYASRRRCEEPAKGVTQTRAIRANASGTAQAKSTSTHGTSRSVDINACAQYAERK